jgi:hypothetical protein
LTHHSLFLLSPSSLVTWVVAIFTFSFIDYWSHRLSHSIPLLWAIHSVHHQVEELNAISGGRVSFVNDLVTLGLLLFLAILGIPLSVTLEVVGVAGLYSVVLHCPFLGSFGWVGEVVASPAFHRLHHGIQPQYLNKNFSISLSFWDKVFGTFVEEDVPPQYGMTNGFATNSPFRANWQPWVDYFKRSERTYTAPTLEKRSLSQRVYLFSQMFLVLLCTSLVQKNAGSAAAVGIVCLGVGAVLGSLATFDGLVRRSRIAFYVEGVRVGLFLALLVFLMPNGNWSGGKSGWVLGGTLFFLAWLRLAFGGTKPDRMTPSQARRPPRADAA